MSTELRPPTFRYVKSIRRRWAMALGILVVSTLACYALTPSSEDFHQCCLATLAMLPVFWIVGRILRSAPPRVHEPREVSSLSFSRVMLPGPVPGTGWLFRRELVLTSDALILRSRFSEHRIPRNTIASITPLSSELVLHTLDGETVRIVTCRLPASFGPLDVAFDHAQRAAGFAGLSYNERIARQLASRPRPQSAYRSVDSLQ